MGATASNSNAKPRKNGLAQHSGEWKGFVDLELESADKEYLAAWVESDEWSGTDMIVMLLGDGYKLSLSPDPKHNCVVATATGRLDACANVGYSMSARGPDAEKALAALGYKIYHVLSGEPWVDNPKAKDRQLGLWG